MSVHLLHKNTLKPNVVPKETDLQYGQLGLQYAKDQVALWTKDAEGDIVRIAYADAGGTPPDLYGYATEQWVLDQEYLTLDTLPPYPDVPDLDGYATEQWVFDQNYVIEANIDGNAYVRQDGNWVEINLSGAGIPEPDDDGLTYGRKTTMGVSSWVEIEDVNLDEINARIDVESLARQDGDDALRELLEEERASRLSGDAELQDQIDNLETGNASLTFADTPPDNPEVGMLWMDTTRMEMRVWYDDEIDSRQWVPISLAFGGVQQAPDGGEGYDDRELRARVNQLEEQVADLQEALATCLKVNQEYQAALVTLGTAVGDLEPAVIDAPVKFTVTS